MPLKELRESPMMDHLLRSLDKGEDIGHYGRLVLTMVGQYFADEAEIVKYLQKNPGIEREEALGLYAEVKDRGYNPPRREQILAWQREQEFPLCPNPGDPDACNLYDDLRFPDEVYERIRDYHRQKGRAAS
ncbi:MAG: hypothetical protein ACYC4L_14910 [Chloroflexota bacterium]